MGLRPGGKVGVPFEARPIPASIQSGRTRRREAFSVQEARQLAALASSALRRGMHCETASARRRCTVNSVYMGGALKPQPDGPRGARGERTRRWECPKFGQVVRQLAGQQLSEHRVLRKVAVRSCLATNPLQLLLVLPRAEQNFDSSEQAVGLDEAAELLAVHVRHPDVEQDEVGPGLLP